MRRSRRHWIVVTIALAAVVSASIVGASSSAKHAQSATVRPPALRKVDVSHYCDGCIPPLAYQGGPVVDTTRKTGLTIIPIYWAPDGYSFPDGYVETINRYLRDVAAASGKPDNVYAIAAEYYGKSPAGKSNLRYKITAGTPILDSNPFPARGCKSRAATTRLA